MAGQLVKALIGKEDCNIATDELYPSTFSRINSVGGAVNLTSFPDIWKTHQSAINAKYYGAHTATRSTLGAAVSAQGTTNVKCIYIDSSTWVIDDDLDLSAYSNIFFSISPGAILQISGGKTLTLYSPANIIAAPTQQIFSGSGDVRYTVAGRFPVGWHGVLTSNANSVNDANLAKAVATGKATNGMTLVHAEAGTYNLSVWYPTRQTASPVVTVEDFNNLTIEGMGPKATTIKSTHVTNSYDVFQLNGVSNLTIRNLGIDADLPAGVADGINGISFTGGSNNIIIENVHVYDLTSAYVDGGASLNGGSAYSIQNNIALTPSNIIVRNCTADGGSYGLMVNVSTAGVLTNPPQGILFQNNRMTNFYVGCFVSASATGATTAAIDKMDISVIHNKFIDCQQGIKGGGVTGLNLIGNEVKSTWPAGDPGFTSYDAVKFGLRLYSIYKSNIVGNIIYELDSNYFALLGGGWAAEANTPCEYINVTGNSFYGSSDSYGILTSDTVAYGTIKYSNLTDNTFEGYTTYDYDPRFRQDANGNVVISSYTESVIPSLSSGVVRAIVNKTAIADNISTAVFSITTANEAGSTDGGTYSVFVHAVISHPGGTGGTIRASKSFTAQFTRTMVGAGTGVNSAVSEVVETASAATDGANRDISTVTMTVNESTEYINYVSFTIDLTGAAVDTAQVNAVVEVVYANFLTRPIIASL